MQVLIRLAPMECGPISCLRVRSQVTFYDPSLHSLFSKASQVKAEMLGHCLEQQCARLE